MPKIYALGETVYDIILKDDVPVAAKAGGSMLNSAVSLGRLGLEVNFVSDMGNDRLGDNIIKFLNDNGINTRYIQRNKNHKTYISIAFLDELNNANYSFYRDFPETRLSNIEIGFEANDIILFGSFFALTDALRSPLIKFLKLAREAGCIIIYDPNFRKSHLHELDKLKPYIIENIGFSDIVRGSDEDFKFIFNSNNVEEAYKNIFREGCTNLIYTASNNGVYVISADLKLHSEVPDIKVVSSIGAGDNFNAGVIWSIIENRLTKKDIEHLPEKSWNKLVQNGIDFASEVCQSYDNYISRDFAINKSKIE